MRIRLVALLAVLAAFCGAGVLLSSGAGAAPSPSAYPPVGPTTGVPTSGVPSTVPSSAPSTSEVPSSSVPSSGVESSTESQPSTPAESTQTSQGVEASSESQGGMQSTAAAGQGGQGTNNTGSGLAFTGSPVGILLEIAAGLLAAGAIVMFAAKRRGRHA